MSNGLKVKEKIEKIIVNSQQFKKLIKLINDPPQPTENLIRAMKNRKQIKIKTKDQILLENIKTNISKLKDLQKKCEDSWGQEDCFYRFYHQSFKVYRIQSYTEEIVSLLKELSPNEDKELNPWFIELYEKGTGKTFSYDANKDWLATTRPMLEAYSHSKMFLDMIIKYSTQTEVPSMLPSGWALVLYLYNIR